MGTPLRSLPVYDSQATSAAAVGTASGATMPLAAPYVILRPAFTYHEVVPRASAPPQNRRQRPVRGLLTQGSAENPITFDDSEPEAEYDGEFEIEGGSSFHGEPAVESAGEEPEEDEEDEEDDIVSRPRSRRNRK